MPGPAGREGGPAPPPALYSAISPPHTPGASEPGPLEPPADAGAFVGWGLSGLQIGTEAMLDV